MKKWTCIIIAALLLAMLAAVPAGALSYYPLELESVQDEGETTNELQHDWTPLDLERPLTFRRLGGLLVGIILCSAVIGSAATYLILSKRRP